MDKIKKKTIAILKGIVAGDINANAEEVERINKFFVTTYQARDFNTQSPTSILVEMDNTFEDVCFVLESHGIQRPKTLSIYEFQRKLELIKKKTKPKKS